MDMKHKLVGLVPEEDLDNITVLKKSRDRHGYAKYLVEDGNGFRGWIEDGVAFDDMRWYEEYIDGWPGPVALDGEDVSTFWLSDWPNSTTVRWQYGEES